MNKIRKKRVSCRCRRCAAGALCLCLLMLMTMLASSCSHGVDYISRSFFAMDTVIEVKLASDTEGVDEIFAECVRLTEKIERMLSAEDGTSEIARFNASASGITVSREVGELFELAALIWRVSGGAFDPTTYPATLLWRSSAESGERPDDEQRAAAVAKCGMELIEYEPEASFLSKSEPWVMLDLGGIGKGYAEARIAEYLGGRVSYGVLSFGGNITVIGERPGGDFTIALRDPERDAAAAGSNLYGGRTGRAGQILIAHGFVSVSGGYERYYEIGGERFCHILDPTDGMPVRGELQSAVVISDNGAAADALSTALFVLDTTAAAADLYCKLLDTPQEFEAVLVYKSEIYITPGLRGRFAAEGGRTLHVINIAE